MADVELVIKISEKVYNALTHIEFDANLVTDEMRKSIANGTPLPKGHGRLIDADSLSTIFTDQYPKNYMHEPELSGTAAHFSLRHILQVLNSESYIPTIIEADKAESEKV